MLLEEENPLEGLEDDELELLLDDENPELDDRLEENPELLLPFPSTVETGIKAVRITNVRYLR